MHEDNVAQLEPAVDTLDRRPTVLIVDDDVDQADVLSHRLQHQGFDPITARTGLDGLCLARSQQPKLVILDLRLPDMDGLDVCEQLADDSATCGIPVIIVSGMERPNVVRQARSAGSSFYVRKPYDPNALLLLIQNAVDAADDWDVD